MKMFTLPTKNAERDAHIAYVHSALRRANDPELFELCALVIKIGLFGQAGNVIKGLFATAASWLGSAFRHRPNSEQTALDLIEARVNAGQVEAAEATMEEFTQANPESDLVIAHDIAAIAEEGHLQEAMDRLEALPPERIDASEILKTLRGKIRGLLYGDGPDGGPELI